MKLKINYKSNNVNIFHPELAIGLFHLVYIHEGKAKIRIDDIVYLVNSGNVIFINERRRYQFIKEDNDTELKYTKIVIDIKYLKDLLNKNEVSELLSLFNEYENSAIRVIIDKKNKEFTDNIFRKMKALNSMRNKLEIIRMESLLIFLLIEFRGCSFHIIEGKSHHEYSEKQFLEEVFIFIERHYKNEVVLDDVSDYLNVSKSYMSKTFKRLMGISIIDYLYEYRINQAKALLVSKNYSIAKVAEKNGFKSTPHFSRIFKKNAGVTPTQFIKLYKN